MEGRIGKVEGEAGRRVMSKSPASWDGGERRAVTDRRVADRRELPGWYGGYRPVLLCARCGRGETGLGTRHGYVRRGANGANAAQIWKCDECGEERRWGN